jgi:hypothetical protein
MMDHREGSTEALPARNHNPRKLKRAHRSFQVESRSTSHSQCPVTGSPTKGIPRCPGCQAETGWVQCRPRETARRQRCRGRKESREEDVESGGGTARNESNTYHFTGCHLEAVRCSFGRRKIRYPYLEGTVRAVPSLSMRKECPEVSAELISTTSPKGGNPAVSGHQISLPQIMIQHRRATAKAAAGGLPPRSRPRFRV